MDKQKPKPMWGFRPPADVEKFIDSEPIKGATRSDTIIELLREAIAARRRKRTL